MTTIVGLSGSPRRGSYNTALLRAAAGLVPAGVTLELRTLHGIPLYDGDAEATGGIPDAVAALKDAIAAADGLLVATPEYNNGMPGVLKNAIDWLSRAPTVFGTDGMLTDPRTADVLRIYLEGFVAFARERGASRP
jgi:chromate reductase